MYATLKANGYIGLETAVSLLESAGGAKAGPRFTGSSRLSQSSHWRAYLVVAGGDVAVHGSVAAVRGSVGGVLVPAGLGLQELTMSG